MLAEIKTLLGISGTDKDNLLNLLIAQAQEYAKSHCHVLFLTGMDGVIEQMVIYRYNRLGSEGVNAENYNSSSYSYTADYPDFIIRQLNQNRKVRVI